MVVSLGICAIALAPSVAAAEGTAQALADVECDADGHGVLDLTFVNDGSGSATFVVTEGDAVSASTFVVEAGSARAVTFTGLVDGQTVVPVLLDGADATVSATVACALPQYATMAGQLPETGSSTGGLLIGSAMVLAGVAASLVSRRRA